MNLNTQMEFELAYNCCIQAMMMEERTTLLFKDIYVFLFCRKGVEASVVCETDGRGGETRQISILTHN